MSKLKNTVELKGALFIMMGKTLTDTLHKESKPQDIAEGLAVHRVRYQKIFVVAGRGKCGRKRCTRSRDDCSLEGIVRQS